MWYWHVLRTLAADMCCSESLKPEGTAQGKFWIAKIILDQILGNFLHFTIYAESCNFNSAQFKN